MKKGGYQIIDLKNFDIHNGNSVKIKGIYNLFKEVEKPLLLSGIIADSEKQQERFIIPTLDSNNYIIDIQLKAQYKYKATVKPDDTVTFDMA